MDEKLTAPQDENRRPESGFHPDLTDASEFSVGSKVVYALHGKCQVLAIEDRQIAGETQRFYKVEVEKSTLSRSRKAEPAIWIPVGSAAARGLRAQMSLEAADLALAILQNKEYFFSVSEPWLEVYPKLEASIRTEGGVGLAKVYAYLFVLKNRHLVPQAEVAKFFESVHRQLMKELSEALHETPRSIEARIQKGLRSKLTADQ